MQIYLKKSLTSVGVSHLHCRNIYKTDFFLIFSHFAQCPKFLVDPIVLTGSSQLKTNQTQGRSLCTLKSIRDKDTD